MPTIRFHRNLKSEFFNAEKRWQRSLPKVQGQFGETTVTTVEHPSIGDLLVFTVDQRFADFLANDGFPL
jgi:hypothetical protein